MSWRNQRGLKRRWWRWLLVGCLLAASGPAVVRHWLYYHELWAARRALSQFLAERAVLHLSRAGKVRPGSAEVEYLLGVAQRKSGHIELVRKHLEKAMNLGWPQKDVRFQLIMLAFQAGDHDAEIALRERLLRPMDDELAEEVYESLALGYLADYRANDAMLVLNSWLDWQPDCVRARLLRGEAFYIVQQPARREEEYRKIVEIDPNNYLAHLQLGHILEENHDIESALVEFRLCQKLFPGDPSSATGIAKCLRQQGKLAEAKQVLRELADQPQLTPMYRAVAFSILAEIAEHERDVDGAVELLSQAIKLDPADMQSHYMLAVCLARSGRKEEAKRYTEQHKEMDRLSQSKSELELRLVHDPSNAEMRYELGEVLKKLGHDKSSAAMMLSALRWDPNHRGAHAALADYYDTIDRDDLAQEHRAAMRDLPDSQVPASNQVPAGDFSIVPAALSVAADAPGKAESTGK